MLTERKLTIACSHGPAPADGAQRTHSRGTAPGRPGAISGPGRRGYLSRADCGGRRGVAAFYRHFRSKHDLLFADYDAGLHWFRAALDARPADESIIDSVQAAIFSFPYDVDAVTKIASLRRGELEPSRIVRHMREVEADFADAIQAQLRRRNCDIAGAPDARLHIAVTARCVAAAVFGAMEAWMLGSDRSLGELARVCHVALESLRVGISDTWTTLTVSS